MLFLATLCHEAGAADVMHSCTCKLPIPLMWTGVGVVIAKNVHDAKPDNVSAKSEWGDSSSLAQP